MSQEQCWWKAALTGATIAVAMVGVTFGGIKGAKALYDETKDLVHKYVPHYDWSRMVASNNMRANDVAPKTTVYASYDNT